MSPSKYLLTVAPTARKQLAEHLPENIAFAAFEFISHTLLENPHRVGKLLSPPLTDRYSARRGSYRIIYRINESERMVIVLSVAHRLDIYRGD